MFRKKVICMLKFRDLMEFPTKATNNMPATCCVVYVYVYVCVCVCVYVCVYAEIGEGSVCVAGKADFDWRRYR